MHILKKLLISSFVLFSLETLASLESDSESRDIAISSFKESLTTLDSESISEKDFLERFELAINNVLPDNLEPSIPQKAQKFRASYQAVRDLYEAYNVILKDKMAEFIGSLQTEDESLIIELMVYKELGILRGYSGDIDYFIKGFIDLWPKKLLTEDKLETFCYAADDKVGVLNLFVNKKLVSEKFVKNLLFNLLGQRNLVPVIFNGLDIGLIPMVHLLEYLEISNLEGKADLINSCIDHFKKLSFTKEQFNLCMPIILKFPNTKPGIDSWPNPYRGLSTRNAIFAFAISRSVISEENLPEYLEQLPKMEQLQLIKDLCEISLIEKRDSVTSWLEKLPCTEFRQFIEAYIEEHITL